jgi:hypothetical protein
MAMQGIVPSASFEIVRNIAETLSTSAGSAADWSAVAQFSAAEEDLFQLKSTDLVTQRRLAIIAGWTFVGPNTT